jgi:hypothetical protein
LDLRFDREAGSALILDRSYRVGCFVRRRHIGQPTLAPSSAKDDRDFAGQFTIFTHFLAPLLIDQSTTVRMKGRTAASEGQRDFRRSTTNRA